MARPRKNLEPILGPGKDPENKLTVQKSLPLFSLWQSDMSLAEFKILDTYLSRINSHKPEQRSVIFTKGELEALLGVKKINKSALSARLNGLGRFVEVERADHKLHKVALFEEACGELDPDTGLWTVRLTCTPGAMKYIFNIEEVGYLKYKLSSAISLTSRYSYILFLYMESNRFRKTWEVGVNDLRQILRCDTEDYCQEFKVFNRDILKRCQKEIHEKTECRFSYEPVKKGKSVVAIRLTLETLPAHIMPSIPGQLSLDDFQEEGPNAIYAEVLPEILTPEEVEALRTLATKKVSWPSSPTVSMECCIADYLRQKVVMMNASRKPVAHPYNYLKTMIERDPDTR